LARALGAIDTPCRDRPRFEPFAADVLSAFGASSVCAVLDPEQRQPDLLDFRTQNVVDSFERLVICQINRLLTPVSIKRMTQIIFDHFCSL
jgi:hypothetical protein